MTARRSACRFYTVAFLTLWHFWNSPTDIGGFFFFPAVIIYEFWFGSVRGCIYRADPNQDNIWGHRKEKTMKNARIFCIIRILELENAGNADSVAVSVNIFQELSHCTPCILAHFENAKVSKMPRGNIEITQIPHTLIPWWSWPLIVQKCKECKGDNEKNRIFVIGKIPSDYLKRLSPDGRI